MKITLSKTLQIELENICNEGRHLWESGKIKDAEIHFLNAWNKIPSPKSDYDYSQELAWGMTLFYRDSGQPSKALEWLSILESCYGSSISQDSELAFIAATIHYEIGNTDEAYKLFHRLYSLYGRRPFQGENQKYFSFYKNHPIID